MDQNLKNIILALFFVCLFFQLVFYKHYFIVNYFEFLSIISIYLMLSMILKMRAFVTNFYYQMLDENLDQE